MRYIHTVYDIWLTLQTNQTYYPMQILYVVAVISLLSFCLYAYSKMTGRKI